jgi:hypothetical protein
MIAVGRDLVGARGALLERLLAVALENKVRGAPDIDFRDHTGRLSSERVITVNAAV